VQEGGCTAADRKWGACKWRFERWSEQGRRRRMVGLFSQHNACFLVGTLRYTSSIQFKVYLIPNILENKKIVVIN
jgi:hypothetical protein